MREFKTHQINYTKKKIQANYHDYDSLLELSAKLLLTIDDAEKVLNELSIDNISPVVVSVSKDGVEKNISPSHMMLDILASLGNEFAIDALEKIYPNLLKGRKFKTGRPKDSVNDNTKHIQDLVKNNPNMTAKEMLAIADKSIIGDMVLGTFSNKVTDAKKKM